VQGTLEINAILGNGFSGIQISEGAVPDIKDNPISWNEETLWPTKKPEE